MADSQPGPKDLHAPWQAKPGRPSLIVSWAVPMIWQERNTNIDQTPQGKSEQQPKTFPKKRKTTQFYFAFSYVMYGV